MRSPSSVAGMVSSGGINNIPLAHLLSTVARTVSVSSGTGPG